MASGATLDRFTAAHSVPHPTAANLAVPNMRNQHPIVEFPATGTSICYFESLLARAYGGGGLTIYLYWLAASATSGDVKWSVAIERQDSGTDLDADSFASAKTVTTTAGATSGAPIVSSIAFTDGAEIDSLAAGEPFRLSVSRLGDDGADTMTGNAQLLKVEIKET